MIEMTWIPEFIRGAVWVYIAAWVGLTVVAFVMPKTTSRRITALLAVTVLFGALPAYLALSVKKHNDEQRPIVEQRKAQYEAAMARFEERCKTAGEKIYRTVEDVEGILLLNVRPRRTAADRQDPNWPDAGMPDESSGEDYLHTFLQWEHHEDKRNKRGYLNHTPSSLAGYKFVDRVGADGGYVRLKLERPDSNKLIEASIVGKPARYAVSFENFVDPEDRRLWVAGTKVTVADMTTKELIAEKTWYAVEPGQGSLAGARAPWGFAKTCPSQAGMGGSVTRFFVDQVLKPKRGE